MRRRICLLLTIIMVLCVAMATVSCKKGGENMDESTTSENSSEPTSELVSGSEGESNNESITATYTISFYDENGNLIESKQYNQGATPSYQYEKADSEEWSYSVDGWANAVGGDTLNSLPQVECDAKYYAVVSRTIKDFALSFVGGETTAQEVIDYAIEQIKAKYDAEIAKLSDEAKAKVEVVYDMCWLYLNEFEGTVAEAKQKANMAYDSVCKIIVSAKNAYTAYEEAKQQILLQLDAMYNSVKAVVGTVSNEIENAYNTAKATISQAIETEKDKEALYAILNEFKDDVAQALISIVSNKIADLKVNFKTQLDETVNNALSKISDEELKGQLSSYYSTEIAKIDAVDSFDSAKVVFEEVKTDTINKIKEIVASQIAKLRKVVKDEIDETVNNALAKIEDDALKTELTTFYNAEMAKLDAIDSLDGIDDVLDEVKTDVIEEIKTIIASQLSNLKSSLKTELDGVVSGALAKIDDDDLRTQLSSYYNTEIAKIDAIDSLDSAKSTLNEIKVDTVNKAKEILASQLTKLKTTLKNELDETVDNALSKISDEELKGQLSSYYSTEIAKIDAIDSLDSAKSTLNEIKVDTINKITEIVASQIAKLRKVVKDEIDETVNNVLAKIEDDALKTELTTFYNAEMAKLDAIDSLDDIDDTLAEIKTDTVNKGVEILARELTRLKTNVLNELDLIVSAGLARLGDNDLKAELDTFYNTEKGKVNAVDSIDSAKTILPQIVEDTSDFVKELAARKIAALRETVKGYITILSNAMNSSAYDYLPDAMCPGYEANLVNQSSVNLDYATNFVNVSSINYGGFGAQWNMVVENINNIEKYYKLFTKADSVVSVALTAANQYLSSKYADTIDKEIVTDTYTIILSYTEEEFGVYVEYKTGIQVALLGNINPIISMTYDLESGEKEIFIKLTDTNAIKYIVSDSKFEFGLSLGLSVGFTTSYCNIEKTSTTTVEGKIYESITVAGKDIKSTAEFYIDGTYVTVVGSKADSIMGFKGYVCELYNKNQGKLLGFEVQEELTFAGITGTYHTLWFNLSDISGITSVKVTEKTNANNSGKSENDTYLNGSSTLFVPTYNKKAFLTTSRKHDVEMKLRYFYGRNAQTGEIEKYEVQVPMMFIQEDNKNDSNYSDYPTDMNTANGITSSVTMNNTILSKIMQEYDAKVDSFVEHKDDMTVANIKTFIGI